MSPIADADGSTVVTLYQPDSLQVRVDVRFEHIPKVSLGQPVQIENAALSEPISGRVLFVSSEVNIQKNTLQVKVQVDSPPSVLKPEMLVDVRFLAPKAADSSGVAARETRYYLPQSLVLTGEGGAYVWLVDQSQGVARRTAVTVGKPLPGGLVEITKGLSIGSRVVARGHESLSDGQRIRIVSEAADATAALPHAEAQHAANSEAEEGR
jgi:multidrug efflux pump subunit AcrA (membrane-fusion protein)